MLRRVFAGGGIFAALIIGAVALTSQTASDPEVQKFFDSYVQTWAKGDSQAIAALYAVNGVRAGSEGVIHLGRDAVERGFAKMFNGPFKGSKLILRTEHDQIITPNSLRITTGTYEIVAVTEPPPGASLKGRFVKTMVLQDGQWLLASSAAIAINPH